MAEIRLDNIKKAYGISLATLVDFLNENGANVEQDPNATVSADFLPIIKKRFDSGITPLKPTIRIFNTSSTLDNANDASWEKLVNAHASDRHVTGTVKRKYKHGFIVEVDGHEGKLPFLSLSNIKNKDNLIGQTIELFVIRVDRITKDVVFTQNSLHRRERSKPQAFSRPILCRVDWFNKQKGYGVVTLFTYLDNHIQIGNNDIFIHCSKYKGGQNKLERLDRDDYVLVSGIISETNKYSAAKWEIMTPAENEIMYISPYVGRDDADDYCDDFHKELKSLKHGFVGNYLLRYLNNDNSPFVDVFKEAYHSGSEAKLNLKKWLQLLRRFIVENKTHHNEAFLCGIDGYLLRSGFYKDNCGQDILTTNDMVSLALAGDLPLSVVSPEILVEKGEELSKISHRIVNEIDSTSSTFEQCFKAIFEHCKITIGEDLYEESTANEVNFLTELCENFNNYIKYSILKEIDIDGYLKDAKDYFEFFISKCNQIEDMVTFRNAFAINNEYVSSTADAILEETIAANINMNEILTAVINGKCQYSAWDKVAKGLNLNDSIARNIINHPELFSESDIREIIRKARSLGIFNSAFELLNGLTDALRSVEVMNVMKDLSQDFKLELFNDLLHSVKIEGFGVEVIDMIENMAKEYYIPSIKNFVDMMANIKSWSWIREITKVRKNIPDVIHNLVSHEIDEYIQQTLGVNASVKDQIEAIDDGYLDIIKSWKDLYNVHTITTIDIDTILNPRFTSYCEEDISALIILIKEEKKYHECLYLAKKIGETIYSETDQFIFKEIPSNEYYKLWLSGIGNQYSDEMFVTAIQYKPSDIYVNTGWGQGLRLSKHSIYRKCADILDKIRERHSDVSRDKIMNLVLEGLNPRGNRNDFQTYLALVEYASLHQIDINFGAPETCLDLKVALWYLDILKKMSFTELKPYIVLFRPCQQQRVLKKVFHLYDRLGLVPNITNIYNLFEYRTEYLSYIAPDDDEGMFDFSCRIVLHSLNQYTPESGYVFDREVFLDILIQQLTRNPKVKYSITGFFSKCDGRTKGWTKLNANNGSIKQVDGGYGITFNVKDVELYQLAADIKTIPGRVYDPSTYMWFIPTIESKKALQFARKSRLMFGFGPGNDYDRNPHLIQLNKTNEICREFCDGIQYGIIEGIDIPIIWCGAERCYQPCRDRHNEDRWEEYTMLDFCRILNYNTDSIDRQGEIIPNGRYLMFVSWVNWFNMMLEHLYCRECGHILSPAEISTLGRYSVTTFVCKNDSCISKDSIYLNTCLNKDCRSVIDSRDCCQCPNEWYICPTCGSCCSNDMIGRRYEALRSHKKPISSTLRRAYEEKSGHVDSNTVFCYRCGTQTEIRDGQYYCKRCNEIISYKNRRTRK